jgi:hypothetical protein
MAWIRTSPQSQRNDSTGSMLVSPTQRRVHHLGAHELLLEHTSDCVADFVIIRAGELPGDKILSSIFARVTLGYLSQIFVEVQTLMQLAIGGGLEVSEGRRGLSISTASFWNTLALDQYSDV